MGVSANCTFFAAFLKVTHPMASAVKITFPTLISVISVLVLMTAYMYVDALIFLANISSMFPCLLFNESCGCHMLHSDTANLDHA